jgi:hypothetical protein
MRNEKCETRNAKRKCETENGMENKNGIGTGTGTELELNFIDRFKLLEYVIMLLQPC